MHETTLIGPIWDKVPSGGILPWQRLGLGYRAHVRCDRADSREFRVAAMLGSNGSIHDQVIDSAQWTHRVIMVSLTCLQNVYGPMNVFCLLSTGCTGGVKNGRMCSDAVNLVEGSTRTAT